MRHTILTLGAVIICLLVSVQSSGQALLKVKPSKMTVTGSSTIHEWESDITKAEFKGDVKIENLQLKEIKKFEVKIPVTSIKSTKGKTMDNKTYEAFRSDKNPNIVFALASVKINPNGTLDAKGTLTMAGVSQPIELQQVKYKVLPAGDVQITFAKTFKMTQWKMEPPTAMMGTIKVGDEVTVNFDFIVDRTPNQ
jgi:polyisoprenoid-binding protein YceI